MALTFNRLVQSDLRIVLRYYELVGGPQLADRFFAEVDALVRELRNRPMSFHPAAHGLRRANMTTFPYHFLFRANNDMVRVLVLRHHRRHPLFGAERR
jgi:plasmid stabilization system protein ParE